MVLHLRCGLPMDVNGKVERLQVASMISTANKSADGKKSVFTDGSVKLVALSGVNFTHVRHWCAGLLILLCLLVGASLPVSHRMAMSE